MNLFISIIKYLVAVAVFGTMLYARGLYLELKSKKEELEEAKATVKYLEKELQEAYKHEEHNTK